MTLPYMHLCVQDAAGNIVDGASITVRHRSIGTPLASPFADEDGATPLGNPYTAADGRLAGCFLAEGTYSVQVTKDALSFTLPYMAVFLTPIARPGYRQVTAAGAVTAGPLDQYLGIKKTVGAATAITVGLAADRDGVPLTIKDEKLDASSNNITIAFTGGEAADGLTTLTITTSGGFVTLQPRDGGYNIDAAQF
jgi:hypothetical protein